MLARERQNCSLLESAAGMNDLGSNFLSGLIGTSLGVVGTFACQSLIEWKNGRSVRSKRNADFRRSEAQMPMLFGEMRRDLSGDGSSIVREVAVIPSRNLIFNSSKRRFAYYEDEHEDLRPKFDILEQGGFLKLIRNGDTPLYRMSAEFVGLLVGTDGHEGS